MENIFHGLGIALVTPFKLNGEIDYDALEKLIEYQLENGADFFTILATTGECPLLVCRREGKTHRDQLSLLLVDVLPY